MSRTLRIRAVAFKEGDLWVVQGLEYDIAAHASDPASVPQAFMKAVVENCCISEQLGRAPLAGIKPAPERFADMFAAAESELKQVRKDPRKPALQIRLAAV